MAGPRSIVIASLLVVGCTRTWRAEVTQPALLLDPNLELRTSLPAAIVLRDMEFGSYPLTNSVYYVVVSRDRLRFHVTLHHKWDDVADLKNWSVYVEDAHGKRHYPEQLTGKVQLLSTWRIGNAVYQLRQPLYRGVADLEIYDRDLFDASGQLTLVLHHAGYEYRYHWISGEPDESEAVAVRDLRKRDDGRAGPRKTL